MWDGSSWSTLPLNPLGTVDQNYWWGMDVAYESQSGDALMVWTDGANVEYATWDGSSWSAVNTLSDYTGATPRQIQLASNPNADEMVLIVSDANDRDTAYVWDGSSWGNSVLLAADSADDKTDINVAYEQQSGHAMVTFADGSGHVYYRMWDGTSWGASVPRVDPPAGVSGNARWTTLASDPNSDRIAMGVLTDSNEIWLSVWDGNAWQDTVEATGALTATDSTFPGVAVAFESQSGDAIATYSVSSTDFRYQTWSSGGGWSGDTSGVNLLTTPNSMMLSSDPDSDSVMLAVQDAQNDIHFIEWDGSSWGADNELETNSAENKNQPFLFLWDQGGNQAPIFITDAMGYWQFDEGAGGTTDDAAQANTGVLGSSAGADANDPTWTTGQFGQALQFDGVDDYVEVVDAPGIDVSGSEFSASLWMKPDSGPNTEDMLFMKGDRQGNVNYYLSWKDTGKMTWAFKDGAGWHYLDMDVTLPTTGDWNHIAIVFDRPTVSLYINGTKYFFDNVATGGSMDRDLTANGEPLWIGAGRSGGSLVGVNQYSGPFTGSIDELALFDRALTDAEIETIRTSAPSVATASEFAVDENSANNTTVGTIAATDPDAGDVLSYAITGGNTGGAFSIDSNGVIKVANSSALDFESNPVFNLTVEATDNGTPALSASTIVTITLNDVNDAPVLHDWYNAAWEFRKGVTIDSAQVADDLADFPVLITVNADPELVASALANGDDILFTSADGVTKLAHEIESYDSVTGALTVWVKTDLSATADTQLFMYFGNAGAANQEDAVNVWDANYVGVYHLNETPTGAVGDIQDSTSNNNHGTTEGSMDAADLVDAQVGKGLDFDEVDDLIRIPDSASLDSTAAKATFELWAWFDNAADGDTQIIMSSSNRYSGWDGYEWASQGSGDHFFYPDAMLPDTNYNLGANPFTNQQWHHLAATMDFDTKEVIVYVDGTPMAFSYEGVPGSWTSLTSSDDLLFGGNPDRMTRFFDGMMDEIRISNVVRSQAWIQTSVNNQSTPATFFTLGVEENRDLILTDINEDDVTSAGDTVASIVGSGGGDRITDADIGAVEGIAVTGVDNTNGQWQYDANADGTWVAFGAVSDNSSVLLDAGAKIRFVPNADYNGSAGNITFRAWDQTSGANGQTAVDVSANGGSTAFSGADYTASLDVAPVNDDPVITSNGGGPTASINVAENTTAVTTVIATDADPDTLSYTISGGADTALFSVNSTTGELTFIAAPNFEEPADFDGDNVYEVTVQVADGNGGFHTQAISVTVTNQLELVVTNTNATGTGSLHEAILNANANVGVTDTITLNIGGGGPQTINVDAAGLPIITDSIILDATTQPGYSGTPLITLDGSATPAASGINGIRLQANDSTVKGFIVINFADEGIEIDGSTGFGDNNIIQNNWVGIDKDGNVAGNAEHGIMVSAGADGNQIGGTGPNEGNVVAGNGFSGVIINEGQ